MPGISDPGAAVVEQVRAAGYRVTPIPGPSALATALSASGLQAKGVLFLGFLPASAPRWTILVVIEDPKALTKPWNVTKTYRKLPKGTRVYDYACAENNRNPIADSGETLTLDANGNVIDHVE